MNSKYKSFIYTVFGIFVGWWLTFHTESDPKYIPKIKVLHRNETIKPLENKFQFHDNRTIADKLAQEVRVLCWVMTSPENHMKKAIHVKRTWGQKCNKLLFMSSKKDKRLNSIALPVHEGRNNLWAKTKEAFKYIYKNHLNDAEWFLKADDDTFVVVENLRYMLYKHYSETPIYFGGRYKPFTKQGFMSGGSGYVLSKEAVKRFVEEALPNKNKCRTDNEGAEDAEMGKCLENIKVTAGDSRDSQGRERFFPVTLMEDLVKKKKDESYWYWKYRYYNTTTGPDCCSDYAVSFHYISPGHMYIYDYLINKVRPYGQMDVISPLPSAKISVDVDIIMSRLDRQEKTPTNI